VDKERSGLPLCLSMTTIPSGPRTAVVCVLNGRNRQCPLEYASLRAEQKSMVSDVESKKKMGGSPSKHYDLRELPQYAELLATPFTVLRSPNAEHPAPWEQEGWRIDATMHSSVCNAQSWEFSRFARSVGGSYGWKVTLSNSMQDPNVHACGWRRVGDFWPTGQAAELREPWARALSEQLDKASAAAELLDVSETQNVLK